MHYADRERKNGRERQIGKPFSMYTLLLNTIKERLARERFQQFHECPGEMTQEASEKNHRDNSEGIELPFVHCKQTRINRNPYKA
jgi:hypothetical protein